MVRPLAALFTLYGACAPFSPRPSLKKLQHEIVRNFTKMAEIDVYEGFLATSWPKLDIEIRADAFIVSIMAIFACILLRIVVSSVYLMLDVQVKMATSPALCFVIFLRPFNNV